MPSRAGLDAQPDRREERVRRHADQLLGLAGAGHRSMHTGLVARNATATPYSSANVAAMTSFWTSP